MPQSLHTLIQLLLSSLPISSHAIRSQLLCYLIHLHLKLRTALTESVTAHVLTSSAIAY